MKKLLPVSVGFILLQLSASAVVADGLPAILDPKGYRQTLPGMPPPEQIPVPGTLKGSIETTDGAPLSGGKVFFFNQVKGPPPVTEKYRRVPDETASLDEKGGFSVELPPGRYYVGAIQRKVDKALIDLPADGDVYYDGKIPYDVLPGSINNINVIRGGKQFLMDMLPQDESVTAIEGSVYDVSGKPVENAIVFAYVKADMNDRPLFVSARTDKSGAYSLRVAGNGTFFLRVSDVYGISLPVAGKVAGGASGNVNNLKAVVVREGEVIKGINITDVELVGPR